MTKDTILDIIADHDNEILELHAELVKANSNKVRRLIEKEIGNLEDNVYRYRMQAKAWGLL